MFVYSGATVNCHFCCPGNCFLFVWGMRSQLYESRSCSYSVIAKYLSVLTIKTLPYFDCVQPPTEGMKSQAVGE